METYIVCPYCGILQPEPHDCEWLDETVGDAVVNETTKKYL